MPRKLRIAIFVLTGLAALPVVSLWIAGLTLDRAHQVEGSRTVAAPPEEVYALVSDVSEAPRWRNVSSVEILSEDPLRWRETTSDQSLIFVVDEQVPNERLVTRMDDPDQTLFGGTWTLEVAAGEGGTTQVTIREEGWIEPAAFRALTRWVWGYDASLKAYLDQLEVHFSG